MRISPRVLYISSLLFVPFIGIMASRVAFPLYVLELGGSALDAGLISAVNHMPTLASYNVGVIQARFGYRRVMALGAIAGGLSMLLPWFFPGIGMLYLAALLSGTWTLCVLPPTQSLVGMLSAPAEVARNFSLYNILAWLTGFLGPLLAGYGIEGAGYAGAFLLFGIAALATLCLLGLWKRFVPELPRTEGPRPGLRATLAVPRMLGVLLATGVLQVGLDMYGFFLPIYGHGLGFSPSEIGILVSVASVSAIAVCFVLPRLVARYGEARLLAASLLLTGASFALLPAFQGFWTILAVSVLYGLGIGGGQPLTTMLTFRRAQKGAEGAAMGLRLLASSLTKVAAPALLGPAASALGIAPVLLGIGALMAALGWRWKSG